MRTLILDAATRRGLLALAEAEDIVAQRTFPLGVLQSVPLVPLLDEMLKERGWFPLDIDRVICGVGPGSYTGIRLAASVAKTLAFAHHLTLIGVPTLAGFVPMEKEGPFAAVLDAKMGGIYYWMGQKKGGEISFQGAPAVAPLAGMEAKLKSHPYLVTSHAESLKDKFSNSFVWEERDPDASNFLRMGIEREEKGEVSHNYALELLYLRKTQAEINR